MIVWAAVQSNENISGRVGCKSGLTKVVASDWNPVRSLIHVLLQGAGSTLSESALCAHSCWVSYTGCTHVKILSAREKCREAYWVYWRAAALAAVYFLVLTLLL